MQELPDESDLSSSADDEVRRMSRRFIDGAKARRKDAERYRFLRDAIYDEAKLEALNKVNRDPQTPAEFDVAVDAAMCATEG